MRSATRAAWFRVLYVHLHISTREDSRTRRVLLTETENHWQCFTRRGKTITSSWQHSCPAACLMRSFALRSLHSRVTAMSWWRQKKKDLWNDQWNAERFDFTVYMYFFFFLLVKEKKDVQWIVFMHLDGRALFIKVYKYCWEVYLVYIVRVSIFSYLIKWIRRKVRHFINCMRDGVLKVWPLLLLFKFEF